MTKLRAKLNSGRGATLIIALVFMLVCVTASVIILAAASSGAGRLSHTRDESQAYLTVSSAAKLLRDGIAGKSYSVTSYTLTGGCGAETAPAAFVTTPTGDFATLLTELYIDRTHDDVTISAEGLPDVIAVFDIDTSHNITITLNTAEGLEARYELTVSIPAESAGQSGSVVSTHDYVDEGAEGAEAVCTSTLTTEIFTVTWGVGTIEKGARQ